MNFLKEWARGEFSFALGPKVLVLTESLRKDFEEMCIYPSAKLLAVSADIIVGGGAPLDTQLNKKAVNTLPKDSACLSIMTDLYPALCADMGNHGHFQVATSLLFFLDDLRKGFDNLS